MAEQDDIKDLIEDVPLSPEEAQPKKKKEKAEKPVKEKKGKTALPEGWSDPITAEKKVKKELNTRKLIKFLATFVAVVLLLSAVIYIALLYIKPNNFEIKTSTDIAGQYLKVSFDGPGEGSIWRSELKCEGPEEMWDLSYNSVYGREHIFTIEEVQEMLVSEKPLPGIYSGEHFLAGMYVAKNDSPFSQYVKTTMSLEFNEARLQDACRVLVGTCIRSNDNINPDYTDSFDADGNKIHMNHSEINEKTHLYNLGVEVYAALSYNERLESTQLNQIYGRTLDTGLLECIAYPIETGDASKPMDEIELIIDDEDRANGYKSTVPFESEDRIFTKYAKLEPEEYMYVFIEIWFEGSDFDCVDSKLDGYVVMNVDNKIVQEYSYAYKNMEYLENKIPEILSEQKITAKEGEEFTLSTPLSDYKINTIQEKEKLITFLIEAPRSIAYWHVDTKPGEESKASEFLESCNTLEDIAVYLSRYCEINEFNSLN